MEEYKITRKIRLPIYIDLMRELNSLFSKFLKDNYKKYDLEYTDSADAIDSPFSVSYDSCFVELKINGNVLLSTCGCDEDEQLTIEDLKNDLKEFTVAEELLKFECLNKTLQNI